MFAARVEHLAKTIQPALSAKRWVICDRFTDSTYAYQGAGRGLDPATIETIERTAVQAFRPDITFILDVPVETGLSRAATRGAHETRFEHFDTDFHGRLRDFFHALATREPDRCVMIDSTAPRDEVAALIWQAVSLRFGI
jgi:dTMP kinase